MDYLTQDFSFESVAALTMMEEFNLIQKVKLLYTLDLLLQYLKILGQQDAN